MNHGRQIKGLPLPYFLSLPDGGAGGGADGVAGGAAGDGGAAGAAGGGDRGAAGGAPGAPAAGDGGQVDPKASDRPAWLPEKFKTPEDFANSYKELERKQFSRKDDVKAEVLRDLEQQKLAAVPKSPGDYTFDPIKLPDGKEIGLNPNDPLVPWFQDKAHKMGLSQEQYGELVKDFIQQDLQRGPKWETEVQALGVDADQAEMRLKRIEGWMRGNAPQEIYDAFAGIPATANMIKLFEHVMTLSGEPAFKLDETGHYPKTVTKDSLREAMADPKYRAGDPSHVAMVRAMTRKLAASGG